ncbi:MAG TPA: twin-arginine translocase TatA/TatE family subunit [Candidatus Altiarchaeales archaeon]|nr:MAG: twin-arginine translocase TatA/TatE family subunit [Candidatus Altiarchaeales archaeon]HDN83768.1 twin-arginine translocase TatA/TatE family subunit [Candidatus Altiarchaeales archaeon]
MIGTTELFIIFIIILLLFGPEKLPELSEALAKAIKNFRESLDAENEPGRENKELLG